MGIIDSNVTRMKSRIVTTSGEVDTTSKSSDDSDEYQPVQPEELEDYIISNADDRKNYTEEKGFVIGTDSKSSDGYETVQSEDEEDYIFPNPCVLKSWSKERSLVTGAASKASEAIECADCATVRLGDDERYASAHELTKHPKGNSAITVTSKTGIESSDYVNVQIVDKQGHAHPNALDLTEVQKGKKPSGALEKQSTKDIISHSAKGEEKGIRVRTYSVVKVRKAPVVPPKSADLKQDLERESATHKNIKFYSETINPADFISSKMEGDESEPKMIGPVYTVSNFIPEGCQQPVHITSANTTERMVLGTGQFGVVVLAEMNGLSLKRMGLSKTDDREQLITVAVKKLESHPSQKHQEAFDREIKFISQLRHPNVLCLLGICYHDSAFIVMEYTEEGDLNQFVKRYLEIVTLPPQMTLKLPLLQLCTWHPRLLVQCSISHSSVLSIVTSLLVTASLGRTFQ